MSAKFLCRVLLFWTEFCLCVGFQLPGCTVCCQVSPNVLPSTFKSVWGSHFCVLDRPDFQFCLLGDTFVPVGPCFCPPNLFCRVLLFWTGLCVDPAPVQESCSRRAALSAAKCFQCTAKYLQSVWGSHFCVYCQVSPNVLPSTFNLSGGVTSVSAAKCLLMYCRVPSICLGELHLHLCFSRALISSAKSFVGSCCFWTELCVDPAPVQESSSRRAALSAAKCFQCTAKYLQSVWGSHFCVFVSVGP